MNEKDYHNKKPLIAFIFITFPKIASAATLFALLASSAGAGELAIEGQVGSFSMAASNAASAVFGSSSGVTFGGAFRYTFWRGAFACAGARTFSKDGQRVFVASPGGEVFPLGHPLSVTLIPIQGTVGWRFGKGSLVPYVGGGAGMTSFEEESTIGGVTESVSETKFSGHVLGGIEFGRGSLRVGAETMWTFVPDSIGVGGVSQVYDESDLGGFSVVGKVVFAFGR